MPEAMFQQRLAGDEERLPYWEAGAGEPVVAIIDSEGRPTRAHALLAEQRRVIVIALPAKAGTSDQAARSIAAAIASLEVSRFDMLGEGAGAAVALSLAMLPEVEISAVVLAAPDGPADETLRDIKQPMLLLRGTKDASEAADRYRALLPGGHFMLVYDAGRAIGDDRPEALTFIAREFFERRDLFLVSRESGIVLP
jgi:pimeloyl-ACP methyl ester carboxylesterase